MMAEQRTIMRRRAEQAWMEFTEWCRGRGLKALPAHPWTVAAFARWCERRVPATRIAQSVRIIARVHLLACQPVPDRHPTVRRTLRAIEARQNARRQGAALFRADDFMGTGRGKGIAPAPGDDDRRERPSKRRSLRNRPILVSRRPGGSGRGG